MKWPQEKEAQDAAQDALDQLCPRCHGTGEVGSEITHGQGLRWQAEKVEG